MTDLKLMRYNLILAIAVSFFFVGCLKKEEYPAEPSITFKRMDFDSNHNATLYIDFIDGDGDFGLDENDWDNSSDSCTLRYNLFIHQYELQNGEWIDVTPPCEMLRLFYRVPWAKPTGQIKTQKGEIKIDLADFWYTTNISSFDTLRMEIQILDRKYNKSNILTTESYIKP